LEADQVFLDKCASIKNVSRRNFCGMAQALDEMLLNVTQAFKDAGIWDNTLLIFSTDNGGQPYAGGNNWPLRGGKNTLWEGGVRGTSFVRGFGIPARMQNTTNNSLMHATDWFPTIIRGVLGQNTNDSLPLDGFDQWPSITQNIPSPRIEILHNVDILANFSALRLGNWKIHVRPDDYLTGWYTLPPSLPIYPTINAPINLFDLSEDPREEINVYDSNPEIVSMLLARLEYYRSVALTPDFPPDDPLANPDLHNGTWTPWITLSNKVKLY